MKNLANCVPTEFLAQTNRLKKSVEKWLTDTDILGIRSTLPTLEIIPPDASDEEKTRIFTENKRRTREQGRKNLSAMLDAMLDKHPQETLEVLALACFVEPKDVDEHPMREYMQAITEMLADDVVVAFFTSFAQLVQMNI